MGIKLLALMQCKGDAEGTFEQELKKLVEASVHDSGCLKYELYQYQDKRCHYVLIEEWSNEEALTKHKDTPHYKHFIRISPVLMEKPVEQIKISRLA